MTAKLLAGQPLADKIQGQVKTDVAELAAKGVAPRLVAVMVGDNPGAKVYAGQQKRSCEAVGIDYMLDQCPNDSTEEQLAKHIDDLNNDEDVSAIILLMPVPEGIDSKKIQQTISPSKDVEGMHPRNMGQLVYGKPSVAPCTAEAAFELLLSTGVELKGKEVVVVGHSDIVGKPLTLLLLASLREAPTPTVCHIATQDLAFHTGRADILFVAAGKAGLITGDMVKEGAIVIDIGINRVNVLDDKGEPVLNDKGRPKKKTVGDVMFEEACQKASLVTPVPGGVGLVTTAMLLRNTVKAARRHLKA